MSKSFSYLLFQNDSICTILQKKNAEYFPSPPRGASGYEVYNDYRNDKRVVTFRLDGELFEYTERIENLHWEIHKEQKKVFTYLCNKATTEFRGRKHEAWFTASIPLFEGPYKFSGLPGLILERYDTKHHYKYSCIGFKKTYSREVIKRRNWSTIKTTREKLNDFLIRQYENPTEYYNSRGVIFAAKINGKIVINPKNYSKPYNLIELE